MCVFQAGTKPCEEEWRWCAVIPRSTATARLLHGCLFMLKRPCKRIKSQSMIEDEHGYQNTTRGNQANETYQCLTTTSHPPSLTLCIIAPTLFLFSPSRGLMSSIACLPSKYFSRVLQCALRSASWNVFPMASSHLASTAFALCGFRIRLAVKSRGEGGGVEGG